MSNHQLIKYAHIWALAVLLACGFVAVAVKGGIATRDSFDSKVFCHGSAAGCAAWLCLAAGISCQAGLRPRFGLGPN